MAKSSFNTLTSLAKKNASFFSFSLSHFHCVPLYLFGLHLLKLSLVFFSQGPNGSLQCFSSLSQYMYLTLHHTMAKRPFFSFPSFLLNVSKPLLLILFRSGRNSRKIPFRPELETTLFHLGLNFGPFRSISALSGYFCEFRPKLKFQPE